MRCTEPEVMPKKSRGRPSLTKSSFPFQSGHSTTPTLYPSASSTRAIMPTGDSGWSAYGSPLTRMMSNPVPFAAIIALILPQFGDAITISEFRLAGHAGTDAGKSEMGIVSRNSIAGQGDEAEDGVGQEDRPGDDHRHMKPGPEAQPGEGQGPGHVARRLEGGQDPGAAPDRFFLEQTRDGQDDERSHEPVPGLVHEPEQERQPDGAPGHQDEAQARKGHAQKKQTPVDRGVVLQAADQEGRQGERQVGPGDVEGHAGIGQPEAGPQEWAVDGPLGSPVEGQDEEQEE